jgi:hypothetical protein
MEGLNRVMFFIGSGFFAIGAAAGFSLGFGTAVSMMVK